MSVAYVDSSALAAIAFDEPHASALASRMDGFDRLISSNLLEAELRAAFMREELDFQESTVLGIDWILPDRTLTPEFRTVLRAGYLRGRRPVARRHRPLRLFRPVPAFVCHP